MKKNLDTKLSRFDETRRARWSRLIFSMCAWLSNRAKLGLSTSRMSHTSTTSGAKSSPRKIRGTGDWNQRNYDRFTLSKTQIS